jgi:hypothetical protein
LKKIRFTGAADLSGLETVDEKVKKILSVFYEGARLTDEHPRRQQLAYLGEAAMVSLLEIFNSKIEKDQESSSGNYKVDRIVEKTLLSMLTVKHKNIILHEFEKNGHFDSLIDKFRFPESEEMIIQKLKNPTDGYVSFHLIDAALEMNKEAAISALLEGMSSVEVSELEIIAISIRGVDTEVDLTEILRESIKKITTTSGKREVVGTLLDEGMKEGLQFAHDVLSSEMDDFYKGYVVNDLQRRVKEKITKENALTWLKVNKDFLNWNPKSKKFE